VIVALRVVTVTGVASQHHDAVGSLLEGLEDKEGIYPTRTRDAHNAQ
jgi:hypothetical protein